MVLGPVTVGQQRLLMAGVDFQALQFLRPWWNLKGTAPEEREAILGSEAARVSGLTRDNTMKVNGQEILITGVLEPTGSQDDGLIFTKVATAQRPLSW